MNKVALENSNTTLLAVTFKEHRLIYNGVFS